ncbi:HPr family phosphocarrier protein [Lentisphaerota bacterium WC36G]|nr:HPr family phosphocarrier protein [Lentisphaerae bacterium WC36]
MVEKIVTIKNHAGIHCRPSSVILEAVGKYKDVSFKVIAPNGESDLSSILGLLSLGLHCDDKATLQISGDKEEEIIEEIASLFEYEFDFPQD